MLRARMLPVLIVILATPIAATWGLRAWSDEVLSREIRSGNLERVKALVRTADDVNARSANGTTPLMIAADAGDLTYVRELLRRGARVNDANEASHTALYWAAAAGRMEVVRELLAAGSRLQGGGHFAEDWDTPRTAAVHAGHRDIARLLAERERLSRILLKETQEASLGKTRPTRSRQQLARWRELLVRGANPNWNNINGDALFALAQAGDAEGVHLLLQFKADPRFESRLDCELVACAVIHGSPAMLDELRQHGANLNGSGPDVLLVHAVMFKRPDMVRYLLERGVDPNRRWIDRTALSEARQLKRDDLVALLLKHGARE